MKILIKTFIGLLLMVVHCYGDELQELLSKSTLIVDRPTLENMKQKSSAIKRHLIEIRQELVTSGSGKANIEWINALHKLYARDDSLISTLEHAKMINLEYESVKRICQMHLNGTHLPEIQILFDQIAQLIIPIDTFSLIVFEYFEQLLESNKKIWENKKTKKTGVSKLISSFRDNSRIKADNIEFMKVIETSYSPSLKPMEILLQTIDHIIKEMRPLNDHIDEIKSVLTTMKSGNETERDNIIQRELKQANNLLRNFPLTEWAKKIYENIEAVNYEQGGVTINMNEFLPFAVNGMPKTFILDCIRMQKIKTRLNTQAKHVEDFIQTVELVPEWLKGFSLYLNTRSKLPESFEDDFELITKKTLKHLEFLVNSDESLKKNDSNAIAALNEYLNNFPAIIITVPYNHSDKSFYSQLYHSQLLIPFRDQISKPYVLKANSRAIYLSIDMQNAINELNRRIGEFKDSLKTDNILAVSINAILAELDDVSGNNQNEIREKLQEITRLINKRIPKLKMETPNIRKALFTVNSWMKSKCIPLMDSAFGNISTIRIK